MTYKEMFCDIYREHRKEIRAYLFFAVLFSLLLSGVGNTFAESIDATQAQGMGGNLVAFLLAGAQVFGIAIQPITALAMVAVYVLAMQVLGTHFPQFAQFLPDTGLMQYIWVSVAVLLWYIASMVMKNFGTLRIGGLTLAHIESNLAKYVVLLMNLPALWPLVVENLTVAAAPTAPVSVVTFAVVGVLGALLIFAVLTLSLLVFLVIRTVLFALDIVLIPLSYLPFFCFFLELSKLLAILVLFCNVFFNPTLVITACVLLLLVCLLLFKRAYCSVRYFKCIYIKPLFARLRGYRRDMPLISAKAPKSLQKVFSNEHVQILIPVFALRSLHRPVVVRRHDRWWLAVTESGQYLCKPKLFGAAPVRIDIRQLTSSQLVIKQAFRFHEFFELNEQQTANHQKIMLSGHGLRFAFSKEYYYRYEHIRAVTGFTEYSEIKAALHLSKREQKLEKKEARLWEKEQKRLAKQTNATSRL